MASSTSVYGGFLQQHAYENVWCTPNQDKQAIFKPYRLTGKNGAWIDFKVMWRNHKLPDNRSRFHVYQIGQVYSSLLGLENSPRDTWINISDSMNDISLMADIYTVKGIQIHRHQVWYKVTYEKDLIFAIRVPEYNRIPIDLSTEDIFIRLYSNAFFQSLRANSADDVIHTRGIQATSNQDILTMQQEVINYRNKSVGVVNCYVNGRHVNNIDLINATVGDYIEYVFDGSVKLTVTFNITSLQQFESVLDNAYKLLLHYAGTSNVIDYQDDIDVYLVRPNGQRFKGVYYNKNNPSALRMLTHKDYSVSVQFLNAYMEANPDLGVLTDMQLKLYIRNSGYARPLVYDENRIHDLYKLSDADLLAAMVGVNAVVDVWKAPNLENCTYIAMMRAELGGISLQNVEDGYGYNTCSVLIGDTPSHTVLQGNKQTIQIPTVLGAYCTVYEYDANGFLLGFYTHNSGAFYQCVNNNAALCEVIRGFASEGLHASWDQLHTTLDENQSYRFYTCGKIGGVIDDQWVDVTHTSQYAVINGQVTWFVDHNTTFTMIRSNKDHITYELDYMAVDGLITFSLREFREDLQAYRTMAVPMGQIDIFLNGKSLVEGLDFIVDHPRIVINNKEYLNDPDNLAQKIIVRLSNFCNTDLTRPNIPDVGYVQYGVLSYNNIYDIREDKVNRVIVDGALYRYSELQYGEQDFDIHISDARNGAPYAIRDIIVPMNDFLHRDTEKSDPTMELRDKSLAIDKAISDYMTLKIPQKTPSTPSTIPAKYQVVSPFFNRIVHDLNSGALWDERFTEQYDDQFVRQICQPYEYLLAWDPITDNLLPDQNFVVIHPHNANHYIDMGIYQYKFLTHVVGIYGSNRIQLSGTIRVATFPST